MGNRAVITLDKNINSNSVGIYLHWNGGVESVIAFGEAARLLGVRSPDSDPSYALARLVQIIGNFFGGTTSVGVAKLHELDCNNGDNGTFFLSWNKDCVVCNHWPDAKFASAGRAVAVQHIMDTDGYWKPGEDGKTILSAILKKNQMFKE